MKKLMLLMILVTLAIVSFYPAHASEWIVCADENQYCMVPGTKMVRYGTGNQWTMKKATDRIYCSNDVFGDPAPGRAKACYYQDTQQSDKGRRPPSGHDDDRRARWVRCANEGDYCRFDGQRDIRYGVGDSWNYKSARRGISCNNDVFGDPAPRRAKACYYQD
jgi:hypothetical protein